MFPLPGFPRTRRVTAEGLPPPVPVPMHMPAAPVGERPTRSTWRSLSPSRLGDDNGWSISPVLRARAGSHADRAAAYVSTSSRESSGGAAALNLNGVRAPGGLSFLSAPHPVPRRDVGRLGGLADVARLGNSMGTPFPGKSGGDGRYTQPLGPGVDGKPARVTTASQQGHMPQVLAGRQDAEQAKIVAASTEPSAAAPFGAQRPPFEADASARPLRSSSETASSVAGSDDAIPVFPCETAVGQDAAAESSRGTVPSVSSPTSDESCDPSDVDETQQIRRSAATSPTTAQGWMAGLSEALQPESGEKAPPSGDLSKSGATADKVGGAVTQRDEGGANGSKRAESDSPAGADVEGRRPTPPPPSLSTDAFGQPVGPFGVTACPSPFVNTSSPLTRGRNGGREESLFGTADAADGGDAGAGDPAVSSAAYLFATHAPAPAADELFSSRGADIPEPRTTDARQSVGRLVEGGANAANVFSHEPPPETPALPPPSLPNPWGSSPLKQPLPEPKRWPTKGGTGFDRPLTPLAAEMGPVREISSSSGEAGAIPAAFDESTGNECGADNGGFGGKAGRNAFQAPPASFMPPVAVSTGVTAKPWENIGRGPSLQAAGVDGTFASASKTLAPQPSLTRYPNTGGFKGYKGRSVGGGWGLGVPATGTPAATEAPRDPNVKPPGVIAVFGFGGRLVCMHPRPKLRLAPAPGVVPSPDDGPALRKGPVNVS